MRAWHILKDMYWAAVAIELARRTIDTARESERSDGEGLNNRWNLRGLLVEVVVVGALDVGTGSDERKGARFDECFLKGNGPLWGRWVSYGRESGCSQSTGMGDRYRWWPRRGSQLRWIDDKPWSSLNLREASDTIYFIARGMRVRESCTCWLHECRVWLFSLPKGTTESWWWQTKTNLFFGLVGKLILALFQSSPYMDSMSGHSWIDTLPCGW